VARDDEVKTLRDDFDHLPGQLAAQRRITTYGRAIFDHHAAIAYLKDPMKAVKLPEDQRGRASGIVLAFGMTCVEAERERLRGEEDLMRHRL
jgi:hypothetical protein